MLPGQAARREVSPGWWRPLGSGPRRSECRVGGQTHSRRRLPAAGVVAVAYGTGSVPFSQLLARTMRDVDLRDVGTGTVSGTALYRIAGFGPLAVAGVADIAKASIGPLLAGRDRPVVAALAGGAAVCGHNWSPWLRGAGGRGLSPAIGALLPQHADGAALLLGSLAASRLVRHTGLGSLLAMTALTPFLSRRRGRAAGLAAGAVVVPMLAKRVLGNRPPAPKPGTSSASIYLRRLLFDNDGDRKDQAG